MATAAVVARILTQYSDKGSKAAQKDIARLEKKISAFGKKAVKSFALAGAATAAFAVKLGVDAVKGAAADEKQQAALAIALRNTTGATDAAIAANSKYLDSLELQVAIDNEQLIPALQKLVTATGDLGQAQGLLSLATDVSAASGKDLSSVTTALSRAVGGNFTALTRLGLPLDQAAIKAKDFAKVQKDLAQISRGQASASAATFSGRMEKLRLSFNQVADQLGNALMPAFEELTNYLITDVVPTFEEFVRLNNDKITENVMNLAKAIESLVKNGAGLASFMIQYRTAITYIIGTVTTVLTAARTIAILASALAILKKVGIFKIDFALTRGSANAMKEMKGLTKAYGYIVTNGRKVATAIGLITTAFRAQGIAAGIAAIATAFATAGASVGLAVTALAVVGVTAFTTKKAMDLYSDSQDKAAASAEKLDKQLSKVGGRNIHPKMAAAARKQRAIDLAAAAQRKKDAAAAAAAAKASEAAKKRSAAIDARNAALKKRIEATTGLRITDADEYETIQLTAVQKLQAKQKEADESLKDRIKLRKEELALFKALSENAQRYTDLLAALADDKLSNKEIELLAAKWGLTVDAAKSYIFTVFAIKDEQISDDEIDKLARAWGITRAQAAQYLDFFAALNDGKLSDKEIAALMSKWGLTKQEAQKYADFIYAIGDGKLDDKEIENLKTKWGLTTQQVVDYILKIGGKVDATGTILSAGDIAALGWTNALSALNAYLAALGKGTGGTPTTTPPVVVTPPTTTVTPQGPCGTARPFYNYYTGECVATAAEIKPRGSTSSTTTTTAGDAISAITTATTTKTINAAVAAAIESNESASNIANAMMTGLLNQGVSAANAGSTARYTGQAIAAQQKAEKEAADLAASVATINNSNYDERFKFRSSVMDNSGISGSGSSSSGTTNINVTVNGSVTSEGDLVTSIRNGLLLGQSNGNSITLQAI
jgi:hypothetical protein